MKKNMDPSIPVDDRCGLLKLPRELRDMIYDFALTEEKGLVKDANHSPEPDSLVGRFYAAGDEAKKDANQLKFTCRQLRAETKGLGLRLNVLAFCDNDVQSGYDVLIHFFAHECSNAHGSLVEEVVIRASKKWGKMKPSFGSSAFRTYCQTHPSTKVTVYLDWLDDTVDMQAWCLMGTTLHRILNRDVPAAVALPHLPPTIVQVIHRRVRDLLSPEHFPSPNLQVFPLEFNETEWLKGVSSFARTDAEKAYWIAQCHAWCKHGFREQH